MFLKEWIKRISLDSRGFTLLEVIIASTIGAGMVLTLLFVPVITMEMSSFVSDSSKVIQDANILSVYINKDISKGVMSVKDDPLNGCISIENMIDYELKYCFADDGLIRRENGEQLQLTNLKTEYRLQGRQLKVSIYSYHYEDDDVSDINYQPYRFDYYLDYPLLEKEGEL